MESAIEKSNDAFSSNGNDEERVMHSKRDNIEIMINDKADEVIEKLFISLLNRCRNILEELRNGGDFDFNHVHLCNINVIK